MLIVIIKSLELKNYRNCKEIFMNFDSGINILYGNNAQGKTNILEAIYVCATTKSHRGSKDRDIIHFNEEDAHICMRIEKNNLIHKIDMHLKRNKAKGVAIDGLVIKNSSELFGCVNIVFFSPEDLNIIKNGPSERRRFIDLELCQLNSLYLYNISNYNKIINQRNNLLKQISFKPELEDTIEIWDMQMVEYGEKIIHQRQKFIDDLNRIIYAIHQKLTGGKEELLIKYEANVLPEEFADKLSNKRASDIKFKITSVGPHRDDMSFYVGDIDIRRFGSQGQQRTAALSLKLAEIELVRNLINDKPILLLDDVLSELDSFRQNYLLESINDIQTIITCTGLDEFVNNQFHVNKVQRIVEGELEFKGGTL